MLVVQATPVAAAPNTATAATLSAGSPEQEFLTRLNKERTSRGLAALANDTKLAVTSRDWSQHMANAGTLAHDPGLTADATAVEPQWKSVGENVGFGYSVLQLHDIFMSSSGHRANVLKSAYNRVGIGVVIVGTKIWVTVRFLLGPALTSASDHPVARGGPVAGDFNGDGRQDVLIYGPGTARDELLLSRSDGTFSKRSITVRGYYLPVAGDFDGNGRDDVLWYGRGTAHDAMWRWTGTAFASSPYRVDGTYTPYPGNFDGDAYDDVLWYGPGSRPDRIGYGIGSLSRFDTRMLASLGGGYRIATGDLDGDGRTDAVLHQRGTASDGLVYGAARGILDRTAIRVDGDYRPVVADLDGNMAADVIWYGVGTRPDVRWQMRTSRGSFWRVGASISGTYTPGAGDFNGDGYDDVLWFTPSSALGDTIWWATGTQTSSQALRGS